MIKLLHAADFHLDSPLGATGPEPVVRRAELRRTAERIFTLAEEEKVDIILLAGDLFDNTSPYLGTVEFIKRCMDAIKIPIFISPGNHDYYGERSPYAGDGWPKNVHIFRERAIKGVHIKSLGCTVWGTAFTAPFCDRRPLQGFHIPGGDGVNLVLLHGEVTSSDSRYGAVAPSDIEQSGADYVALGHIHACSGPHALGGTVWAWPGCPEGRGFDETGEKGVMIAEIEKGRIQCRFVPIAARRYFDLTVDADGSSYPLQTVLSALPDDMRNDICRLTLKGESGETGIDIEALRLALKDRFYALELLDQTVLRKDIWACAEEDSLRGLFLKALQERSRDVKTPHEEKLLMLAARFGLAALDGREPPKGGREL